jgi:sugar/nucleoside kinase (ribokinase family)
MSNESDIVILGHVAKDIIETDGKSHASLGGAVYYGGIAGAHMGLKIAVVTRLRREDFVLLNVFSKHGIKYHAYSSNQTSGLKNIYSSENIEHRDYEPLGFAGLFEKREIPEISTKFFVIGPIIAGEVDLDLLDFISSQYRDNLCLDIQGFIRKIVQGNVFYEDLSEIEKEKIFSKVKILKIDQKEAEVLTNQNNINQASKDLIEYGPEEILITHEKGITVNASNEIFFFPWKNKASLGRTGRGDTAFISYLGARLTKNPEESLKFSAALTSLKLENPGPFSLPLHQVEKLIKEEY